MVAVVVGYWGTASAAISIITRGTTYDGSRRFSTSASKWPARHCVDRARTHRERSASPLRQQRTERLTGREGFHRTTGSQLAILPQIITENRSFTLPPPNPYIHRPYHTMTRSTAAAPSRSSGRSSTKQAAARRCQPHSAPTTPTHQLPQAPTDPQWRTQVDQHFLLRKQVIARLQRLHPVLSTNSTMHHAGQVSRISELVQRLELMLYKAASSLDEYMNPCTLERRVHSLVTMLEPLPPPTLCLPSASRKRQLSTPEMTGCKRRRRSPTMVTTPTVQQTVGADANANRLTSLNTELLGHVFGYLEGMGALRSCSLINRFMASQAPTLVSTLTIDVADAAHANFLQHRVGNLLSKCRNLEQLVVTNSRNNGRVCGFTRSADTRSANTTNADTDGVDPRTAYATAVDPTQFTGRVLLYALGQALYDATMVKKKVLFPRLHSLHLLAPFDCANEADATIHFLSDLAANFSVTPHRKSPLQSLVLDTTVLGDRRLPRLTTLMNQYPRVFHHELHELVLANNFIGEAGARQLCSALTIGPEWKSLRSLSLRHNMLSDHDACQLASVVVGPSLLAMQSLDVSENYIGKPGFQALADSARRRCVRVHVAVNCMDTNEAARLFM